MSKSDSNIYDAVIIGAGISGLVCGSYLAKAGLKVLIAEQHHKPGGYCTSFQRQGYLFDAAAHSFGGYRQDGIVRKVFEDLNISNKIIIKRFDPSDIIMTPDYMVSLHSDFQKTIMSLQNIFQDESDNLEAFFSFLLKPDLSSFAKMRSWSFKNLLDHYFKNAKLKSILAFPVYGNGALPPSQMSAFIGAKIFTEFLIDGGYYPKGGMQVISDALAKSFQEYGGTVWLSAPVNKIKVKDHQVTGIVLGKTTIASRYIISNCDARQTFLKLIGRQYLTREFQNKLNDMRPSLSMFVLYLGMSKDFIHNAGSNIWYLPRYNLESMYEAATCRSSKNISEFMMRISPDRRSILAFIHAPYRNKTFWLNNKENIRESLILHLSHVIPDISKHIILKETATPNTMYRYTLNYRGAAYGWQSSAGQLADIDFRIPSFLNGLYLTGHWTTEGLGIPGVTYLGFDTARRVIKKFFPRKLV
jgi:phytoene dehydrogenase-like protein